MFTPFQSIFSSCIIDLNHSTVCVDRSQSDLHIWTLQLYSILPCKTALQAGCTEIRHEQPFSSPATNSLLDWGLGFESATPEHSPHCPLNHFCVAFSVRFQALSRWKINLLPSCVLLQIVSDYPPGFPYILLHSFLYKPSRACCWEASPQQDATTTLLHGADGVFVVMTRCCDVIGLKLRPSKDAAHELGYSPNNLLPVESPTCLWVNSGGDLMWFLQQCISLCHSPIRLWLVKTLSNSCCMQSRSHLSWTAVELGESSIRWWITMQSRKMAL